MSPLAEKMDLIASTLQALCPERIVSRNYRDFAAASNDDLKQGRFTVLSRGEPAYLNHFHRPADESRHSIWIVGQIMLPRDSHGSAIEDAEFEMVEDVKRLVRSTLPVEICTLELKRFVQSHQMEAPRGWVRCELELNETR